MLTFFAIHGSRGKEAIQAAGIIPQFTGWLMHDFLSSYLGFENCLHTFCKRHLLREWVFLFEEHHQRWAGDLHDLFLDRLQYVRDHKARDAPMTQGDYERWRQRTWKLLRTGRRANPLTPQQKANPRAQRHAPIRSSIDTLRKHGLPVLKSLRRALDGRPFLPQPSQTT